MRIFSFLKDDMDDRLVEIAMNSYLRLGFLSNNF